MPARATPGAVLYVQKPAVALRAEPKKGGAVVSTLPNGQKLLEFRRQGNWVKVLVFGKVGVEGWIRSAAVGPDDPLQVRDAPVEKPTGRPPARIERRYPGRFLLRVDGTPALKIRANCLLVRASGKRDIVTFRGLVPKAYRLTAEAVSCFVQKMDGFGRLYAALMQNGRIVVAEDTAARFNFVELKSPGPWGGALAARGGIPTLVLPPPPPRANPRPKSPLLASPPKLRRALPALPDGSPPMPRR